MNETQSVGGARKDILAAATQFLRTCYDQDPSLSETAAAAGVGPRALQIAFREGLNTTPGDWLLKLRL